MRRDEEFSTTGGRHSRQPLRPGPRPERQIGHDLDPRCGIARGDHPARREINRFIRGGAFDAVLDFDRVLADPIDHEAIRAGHYARDHLHSHNVGYRALAESICLSLFPR